MLPNAKTTNFRWFLACFGVLVAPVTVYAQAAGTAATPRRGITKGEGYNLSDFSNLGCHSAGAKTGRFLRRHSKGENVKSFVPGAGAKVVTVPQTGERQEKMGHLSN
jgi:hypothetical protein